MLFAYPYGEYSNAAAEAVRQLGFVAFGQQSGAISLQSDLRALPRYPMSEKYAGLTQFINKVSSPGSRSPMRRARR